MAPAWIVSALGEFVPEPAAEFATARKIVVAEDDPATRALLVRQLERSGYRVFGCDNGRSALNAVEREAPGMVLADWGMPEMDGISLLKAVRELSNMNALPFIYFLLLTASSEKQHVIAGLEAGADDYLTKPYDPQELLARLRAGERILDLQTSLQTRQLELQRVNADMCRLNARLKRLANTDGLTELFNRRYLFDRLVEMWAIYERHRRPLSCIVFDVDRFKRINDSFGHAAGDGVLRNIAEIARKAIRTSDVLARHGGEEFCVLCPETDARGAAAVAERIRASVQCFEFQAGSPPVRATISLGVAGARPTMQTFEELLAAADQMLYRAKDGGRNAVGVLPEAGSGELLAPAAADQEFALPKVARAFSVRHADP